MSRGLALDRGEQVGDVIALEQQLAQRLERRALLGYAGRGLAVPPGAGFGQGAFVLVALGFDGLARGHEPRRERRGIRASVPGLADLVELLVQREYLFKQARRHLRGALVRLAERQPLDRQQVLDARDRLLQRAIGVVEIRRTFEAGKTFGRRGVVVEIGVKLAAQIAEAPIELLRVELEPPRHAEEREIVTVPAERLNPAALRAEVLVHRNVGAAVAALRRRERTDGQRLRCHWLR